MLRNVLTRGFATAASKDKQKVLAVLYKAGDAAKNPKLLGAPSIYSHNLCIQ